MMLELYSAGERKCTEPQTLPCSAVKLDCPISGPSIQKGWKMFFYFSSYDSALREGIDGTSGKERASSGEGGCDSKRIH